MKAKLFLFLIPLCMAACRHAKSTSEARDMVNSSDLKKIIAQKDFTLIYFWTTWCGPCRHTLKETLPQLEKMLNKSKAQLILVAVSKDEGKVGQILNDSGINRPGFMLEFTGPDIFLMHKSALENTLEELFPEEKVWQNSIPVFILADKHQQVVHPRLPKDLPGLLNFLEHRHVL